ncbi:hypothetical protein AGMMS50293_00110 [Spirochaetia bacterium]|nr:hypothetical protein AGMMS50293_00110 [Spirochaetia bacterium]
MEAMVAQRDLVRSPVVGGIFYPDEKAETLNSIRSFGLKQGQGGFAQAIIAPHGAWDISGSLAGAVFAAAGGRSGKNSPSRVVLLGPIHDREEGLFLSDSHFFQTPLGNIPVDQEISGELESCSPLFEINDIPHLREHSLEVLLPFVKYCFPKASIVPILMGQPRAAVISALAHALNIVFEPILEDTLLVVSCNLSSAANKTTGRLLAVEALRLITGKNAAGLSAAVLDGRINICGGALVASLLKSGLLDATEPCLTPGSMFSATGEGNNTVFYGALSFE